MGVNRGEMMNGWEKIGVILEMKIDTRRSHIDIICFDSTQTNINNSSTQIGKVNVLMGGR